MKILNLTQLFWSLCLVILTGVPAAHALGTDDLQARTYIDAAGKTLPYRLFVPPNYDAKKQYPLVIFLHGAGERGTDNSRQLAHSSPLVFVQPEAQAKQPAFFLAPQCPNEQQWVNTPWGKGSYSLGKVAISDPLRMTLECVKGLEKEFSFDPKRFYITGISMGGYGTWDAILRNPTMFAAAVPICGAGDPAQVALLQGVGIWAFHSADDGVVPVSGSRDMIRASWADGQTPSYTEYLTYGHNSWDAAYATPDLVGWLFTFHR